MCFFDNIHKGHKLIKIEDEESLKKENISINSASKLFIEIFSKTKTLKEKIEIEITKINEQYDNLMKQITKSYEIKHEKLTLEENEIKENLQIEVTKIKEKIENFLTECNDKIRISEKINKGISKLENEKEKNILKVISYISKINKIHKEMEILFKELLKSSKSNLKILITQQLKFFGK